MIKCFPTSALVACAVMFSSTAIFAEDESDATKATPSGSVEEDTGEPAVTIIDRGNEKIEEYRAGGRLYMIKVTPKKGLPYYLMDVDGDGQLDTRRNDSDFDVVPPRWTIFEWK